MRKLIILLLPFLFISCFKSEDREDINYESQADEIESLYDVNELSDDIEKDFADEINGILDLLNDFESDE